MPEENKTTNDLYREVINLHEAWHEENKKLLSDNHTAISTLNALQKRFEVFTRVMIGLVAIALIIAVSVLVYKGKISLCEIEFAELILTTDNCLFQND